jgi:putative methionine-R-sulfoxide reductase with GAF domain
VAVATDAGAGAPRPAPAARRVLTATLAASLVAALAAAGTLLWLVRAARVAEAHRRGAATLAAAAILADLSRAGGRSFHVLDQLRDAVPGTYAIMVVSTVGRTLGPPGGAPPLPAGAAAAEKPVAGVGKVVVVYAVAPPLVTPLAVAALAAPLALLVLWLLLLRRAVRRHVVRPLAALDDAIAFNLEGDFVRRPTLPAHDRCAEVDALLQRFNRLLARITDLSVSAIDTGRELDETRRELQLKAALEEQKRTAESANRLLEARVRELALLFEVSRVITSTLELDEVLRGIATVVAERLDLQELTLMLLDERRANLVVRAAHGFVEPRAQVDRLALPVDRGIAGLVARTGELCVANDVASDARYEAIPGGPPAPGSLLCVPARSRGAVIGVINFGRSAKNAFRPEDILYLSSIADQCAIALGNAQLYERAVRAAAVTGAETAAAAATSSAGSAAAGETAAAAATSSAGSPAAGETAARASS